MRKEIQKIADEVYDLALYTDYLYNKDEDYVDLWFNDTIGYKLDEAQIEYTLAEWHEAVDYCKKLWFEEV